MANSLVLNTSLVPASLQASLLVDEAVPATTPVTIRRVGVRFYTGVESQNIYWEVGGSETKAQSIITNSILPFLRRGGL